MKELSPNNRKLKLTLPILYTVFAMVFCIAALKNHFPWLLLGIALIGLTGFFFIFKIYNNTENIFYDNDYLYLKKKNDTQKIELNKIRRLKLSLTDQRIFGFQFFKYKIEFTREPKLLDSVTFWTSSVNSKLQEFEKHLNYYSPETVIEHKASTFD